MTGEPEPSPPGAIPVVAVALIGADGRVLLQQRRLGGRHGGLWEFPGGKVEPGESLVAALVREIREELGVTLDPAALVETAFAADSSSDGHRGDPHLVLLYACAAWRGEPRCLDGEAIGWFTADEAAALPLVPLDRPLARHLPRLVAEAGAARQG